MSEEDSDSDDEGPRSLKTRKRKFSITPVYEIKVTLCFSPRRFL